MTDEATLGQVSTTIKAVTDDGIEVDFHSSDDTQTLQSVLNYLRDPDSGFKPRTGTSSRETQAKPSSDLACQFCPNQVEAYTDKNGKTFSPADLVKSRSEKMVKMGRPSGTVCGNCWTKGGHSAAWQRWYNKQK